jgi:lipopolysaccharide transport system ATP-binding protein
VSSVQRPESSAKKTNLTTEDTESTEVAAEARLAGQAGGAFLNPSTSELARDSENTSLIRSANAPRSSEEQSDSKALDSRPSTLVSAPKAQAPSDWVYALKDVSFEVKRGEVLGIIGRNGAGKSTLLKILSRVTTQSSGQIKVKGRIASLLEVGTGFHPELTGRENIFLNGAILGMRKAEIARKFDEIVEFSGCARYIDTPVKRYSSGMYVRLAFAVAAHLEPEILIVDEVLAVGDAEFQKKCLGKMKDVAGHGRTVLFVSHNMASLESLCTRGIYLQNGEKNLEGDIKDCIERYILSTTKQAISSKEGFISNSIERIEIRNAKSDSPNLKINPGDEIHINLFLSLQDQVIPRLRIGLGIDDTMGRRVTTVATYHSEFGIEHATGKFTIHCRVPSLPLAPGEYSLKVALGNQFADFETVERAASFEVIQADFYGNGRMPRKHQGPIMTKSIWEKI